MLDKSVPYKGILMRRPASRPIPAAELPDGYSFSLYRPGDEIHWARIETSVLGFETELEAYLHVHKRFMLYAPDEVPRRLLFIRDSQNIPVANLLVWWEYTGTRRDPCIHFVGVRADRQGMGLGKAIIYEGMRLAVEIEGDRDIYLSTSTWCHKAVGIYIKAGFEIHEGDFGGYKNFHAEALEIMRGLDLPYKI